MKSKFTILFCLLLATGGGNLWAGKLYTSGLSASSENTTFTSETNTFAWTDCSYNANTAFEFSAGFLSNFSKIHINYSGLTSGKSFRIFIKSGSNNFVKTLSETTADTSIDITSFTNNSGGSIITSDDIASATQVRIAGGYGDDNKEGNVVISDLYLETADNFTISNTAEWTTFQTLVNAGVVDFNAQLTADVDAGSTIVGTSSKPYQGTFDGAGKTLTFTKTNETASNIAPFGFIKDATIKNLITTGEISSSNQLLAGIVSESAGTSTITNCTSSMTITSTYPSSSGDATCGGILARGDNGAKTTITNCAYTGTLTAEKGVSGIAGFFRNGETSPSITLKNLLFAGTISCTSNSNVCNIYRTYLSESSCTTDKLYYINKAGNATDGTQATSANLLNGTLAKELADADDTGNTLFWGQGNLNKSNIDAYPNLTSATAKKVVQVKIQYMGTKPCVNPGGAVPNPARFGKVSFKLDTNDEYSLETMPEEGGTFTYGTEDGASELYTTPGMYCITMPAQAITLMLPFNASLPEGITAYDITYKSGDNVTATSVNSITANKPVLINGKKGTRYKFTNSGDAFDGTYEGTLTDGVKAHTNGALTGVYVDANASGGYNPIAYVPANSYVLQNGADGLGFYKVETDNTIKITSFRAYATFTYSAGGSARQFFGIDFSDNETTGIQSVNDSGLKVQGSEAYYNLSGQRVSQPTKGLYIVNGKKVIIK